ncbi:hypothetical protein KAS14_01390 [Candidatus Bathyarchaeota archaeon]|nr:hypothetical protein [Candidatus Bathyarchaeota archaeon]
MKNSITVMQLVEIQRKAMRRRVWFKVLERTERAILQLTILCVNRIRSPKLTKIVKDIVVKLKEAMKGRVKKLTKLGRKLALDLSQIALNWGRFSYSMAKEPGFYSIFDCNSYKRAKTLFGLISKI